MSRVISTSARLSLTILAILCSVYRSHGQTLIHYGDVRQDTLSSLAQRNPYVFSASRHDVITIWMVGGGSFTPTFALYDPYGRQLKLVYPHTFSNTAYLYSLTLDTEGQYTLLAYSDHGQQIRNT